MNGYKAQFKGVYVLSLSLMSTRQKRARQGSSSQPAKKPFLDVDKQGSDSNSTRKSTGKHKEILKPNVLMTNSGERHSTHSARIQANTASKDGIYLLFFLLHWTPLTLFQVGSVANAETSTRLSDYNSTLIISAPPAPIQAKALKPLCMYIHSCDLLLILLILYIFLSR